MNLKHRKKSPTNVKDRQRRFICSSHIRIFLTVTFIVSLLIVFRLIQPGQHSLLADQLNALAPALMNSALFFLVLAICSLGGLVWYGADLDTLQHQEQAVKKPLANVVTGHNEKIASFTSEHEEAQVVPLRPVAAHV